MVSGSTRLELNASGRRTKRLWHCKGLSKRFEDKALIEDLELLDYRVRVFQGGTDAVTRVLIEFGDSQGNRWSTVGVSANIIDASFQGLLDSINYKLMKAEA